MIEEDKIINTYPLRVPPNIGNATFYELGILEHFDDFALYKINIFILNHLYINHI